MEQKQDGTMVILYLIAGFFLLLGVIALVTFLISPDDFTRGVERGASLGRGG